ncbi:MAG: sulfurtransferase [Sarcina sp.]
MNSKFQKAAVAIIALVVFFATFFGSTKEQVVVEARKIVSDSNNINNNYLIGVQSLESILTQKNLVILDIRNSQEYDKGHIPGAINVSWSNFVDNTKTNPSVNSNNGNSNQNESGNVTNGGANDSATNNTSNSSNENSSNTVSTTQNNTTLNNTNLDTSNWTSFVDKTKLTKQLQELGITQNSEVVVYGDSNGDDLGSLGKFSWMFRMIGINSKMLNGGYKNWVAQGFPITTEVPNVTKSNMQIENFVPVKTFGEDGIAKNIDKIKIVELINDVKENDNENVISPNSDGANSQKDLSNGVESSNLNLDTQAQDNKVDPPIKGVIRIKLSDLLNPNGTIKPINQLDNIFESNGIDKDDIILFYNTDTGNLAFLSLIMNMAGYEKIAHFNANLTQVTNITNQLLKEKEQESKKKDDANNSNGNNQTNNNSSSNNNGSNSSATNQNTQTNNGSSSSTSGNSGSNSNGTQNSSQNSDNN